MIDVTRDEVESTSGLVALQQGGVLLSVVIVSWNTREKLKACLSSLADCGCEFPGAVEVLVVDNASSDGSAAMVEAEFPEIRLLQNGSNLGFARANNQAIRESNGSYLLLLNSDTELLTGAPCQLVRFMEDRPQIGAAGPLLLNSNGTLQPSAHPMLTPEREFWRLSYLDYLFPKATYRMEAWDRLAPRQVGVLKGACLLLRREALEAVGLLDDSYFMYTEEVDLCFRLAEAGWQSWWVPGARVVHHGEASSRQAAEEMYIQLYRSKVQFYRKYGGEKRAKRFKRLIHLAYWPRIMVAALLALASPRNAVRVRTYRRLLAEIAGM